MANTLKLNRHDRIDLCSPKRPLCVSIENCFFWQGKSTIDSSCRFELIRLRNFYWNRKVQTIPFNRFTFRWCSPALVLWRWSEMRNPNYRSILLSTKKNSVWHCLYCHFMAAGLTRRMLQVLLSYNAPVRMRIILDIRTCAFCIIFFSLFSSWPMCGVRNNAPTYLHSTQYTRRQQCKVRTSHQPP